MLKIQLWMEMIMTKEQGGLPVYQINIKINLAGIYFSTISNE